jgi:hypothetical protein
VDITDREQAHPCFEAKAPPLSKKFTLRPNP